MTQGVNFFTNPNAPSSNAMRLLAMLSSLAAPKTGMFDNDELKTGSRNILG